ncbi:MAG: glycosyltransferase family 2 protein [Planctomycetes bacterium]|nr:glycosyltransferase family 2 protein [Planctomycetota bacterium]
MIWTILAGLSLLFALIPAVLYAWNVRLYRSPSLPCKTLPPVSILIPARNESLSIGPAIEATLATQRIDFEIVVLDDHSEDDTAAIVKRLAASNGRIRLEKAPLLPPGWCGKQHACFTLAKLARHPVFCFIDADVRLAPDGLARMVNFLETSQADLVSGFPRQVTETILEWLLIPLIHFLLLGFLPISRMRKSRKSAFSAGCGQLFVCTREAYEKSGGHEQVKASLHDGLTLPRAFRKQGFRTDLCDATEVADCRMYHSAREVWFGLAKNAREGLASAKLIVPATLMLLMGQVLPVAMLLHFIVHFARLVAAAGPDFGSVIIAFEQSQIGAGLALASLATLAMYYPRFEAAYRFRQPLIGALLHPFGMVILLMIQWYAALFRRTTSWKGRTYPG